MMVLGATAVAGQPVCVEAGPVLYSSAGRRLLPTLGIPRALEFRAVQSEAGEMFLPWPQRAPHHKDDSGGLW